MSAYTGDVNTLTQQELMGKLNELAADWRAAPSSSNGHAESERHTEITEALKSRFGVDCRVVGVPEGSTNYQVVCQ